MHCYEQVLNNESKGLVKNVQDPSLKPLRDGGARVPKPELLQDEIDPHRFDLATGP